MRSIRGRSKLGLVWWLSFACLGYVLWRPVSNQQVLGVALVGLLVTSLWIIATGDAVRSTWQFRGFILIYLIMITIGLLVGSMNGNPGVLHQALIWYGQVAIWAPWALAIRRETLRPLLSGVTVIVALVSLLIVIYIFEQRGLLPHLLPDGLLTSQDAGFNLTRSGSAIRLYGLSTLAAGGPLLMSMAFLRRDRFMPPKWLCLSASMLVLAASLMSGRRAIAAVTLLSPLIAVAWRWWLTRDRKPIRIHASVVILLPPALCLGALNEWSWSLFGRGWAAMRDGAALFFGVGSSATGEKALDDQLRSESASQLLTAWGGRPLQGYGLGAELPSGFTRSVQRPWMFELQYHQFLFDLGMIGVTLSAAMIGVAVSCLRAAVKSVGPATSTIVATSTAATCLLLANASDPYLQTYGHGWGIALAAGAANAIASQRAGSSSPLESEDPVDGERLRG